MNPHTYLARILRGLRLVVLAAAVVYGSIAAYLYFGQAGLVFYPTREWVATPESAGLAYENVSFRSEDGTALSGWWVNTPGPDRGTVLFCHGNAKNISDHLSEIRLFHKLGLNVFIFDYRGYGKSGGTVSEEGLLADTLAAYEYLVKERHVNQAHLVVAGRSLGTSMAAYAAACFRPAALILESGFVSLSEVGESRYPIFPVKYLLKYRFETGRTLSAVHCPVLVVHSSEDRLVPFWQGKKLFEMAGEPKEFFEISGPHHDGYHQNEAIYREKLRSFLKLRL